MWPFKRNKSTRAAVPGMSLIEELEQRLEVAGQRLLSKETRVMEEALQKILNTFEERMRKSASKGYRYESFEDIVRFLFRSQVKQLRTQLSRELDIRYGRGTFIVKVINDGQHIAVSWRR